jgi:tRNA (cytidine/uridine-2'-O-)-methyltransferase
MPHKWRKAASSRNDSHLDRSVASRFSAARMRIALFEPDIAANTGTIIRLGACMGVGVDVIEPCGFPFGDASMKRASLDYLPLADLERHDSWDAFLAKNRARLVLATTKAEASYAGFAFEPNDTLIFGRESAGVTDEVVRASAAQIRIPMKPGLRSLNVALSAAIIVSEALRQTGQLP